MTSSSSSSPEISSVPSADSQDRFSHKYATHEEVLEDLSSRFILNLPDEELASLERICFQVEQAHWFYEDFIREENPKFPSLPLKKFSAMLFHACPLLHQWSHDHEQAFNTFMQYKTRVPVCGAIMLNDTWDKCILVKGWKSSSGWGFPKGKINEDEAPHNCAIREVHEETGYNLAGKINRDDVIEMSIKEQKIALYIVPGVPEDYPFKTKTRKEISRIEWFKLTDLPTWRRNKTVPGKFYLISPFIGALRNFVNERRPRPLPLRKGPKAKMAQQNYTIVYKELDGPIASQSYSADQDASAQESSSQSSSADNGDPETPSPQYSEPIAVSITTDDEVSKVLATKSIDPHFARLLTSLSMSAAPPTTDKENAKPPLAPIAISTPPASSTPAPVTASSTNSNSFTDSTDQGDWSTHAPARLSISAAKVASQRNSVRSPPTAPLKPQSTGSRTPSGPYRQLPTGSAALPSVPASASMMTVVSPTLSPTRKTSRRSSSTADISPYLSRPPEVPTSGKRLKQLALLESVADDATARMTPPPHGHRQPPPSFMAGSQGLPNSFNGSHVYPPAPPASVPPPSTLYNFNDAGVIYSSGSGGASASYNLPPSYPSSYDDPFQVRPRSSHAFRTMGPSRPTHSTRGSLNQSQLLSLLNVPGPAPPLPPPVPNILPTASSFMQGPYRAAAFPQQPPRVPMPPVPHPSVNRAGFSPAPFPPAGPHQFYSSQPRPAMPSGPLPPPTNHANPNLLSILNGKDAALGPTSMIPSVINNAGHR